MLQIALKLFKIRFLSSKQSFWIDKNMFDKIFFPMVPPLVLWSPLKFFFDQFWKFLSMLQIALKILKKRFLSSKQSFWTDKNMFEKFFFQWCPLWSWWSPLKFFFDQFWKFFIYASNCFENIEKTFSFIKTIILNW